MEWRGQGFSLDKWRLLTLRIIAEGNEFTLTLKLWELFLHKRVKGYRELGGLGEEDRTRTMVCFSTVEPLKLRGVGTWEQRKR